MTVPLWAWAGTLAVIAVLVAADLVLASGAGGGLRAAAVASALWIAAGLAFGAALWPWQGPDTAGQYFAGYLLEKALSVDNIFVFVVLFASLEVPAPLQRRVLYLGVLGALVLISPLVHLPVAVSLGVIIAVAGSAVVAACGAPGPGGTPDRRQ
jgi:tellurite resistance protein TerC